MTQLEARSPVLSIDIGGTKIASAVVDSEGFVVGKGRVETPDTENDSVLCDAVEGVARAVLAEAGMTLDSIVAVGVSSAGIIDTAKGIVVFSPNVAALRRTPLKSMLGERFGKAVSLGNDATLAALGEWEFGLKRSVSDLVYVTVSTGIGGGIIAGGTLLGGACGAAGEVGHMTIDVNGPACPCGQHGCWESLASGRALAERTVRRLEDGDASSIGELCGGDMEKVDAQLVAIAALQGDALAKEMIETTAYYVGVGLANLINIFNPEIVLLGGGVTKIGPALLEPAAHIARERAYVTWACEVEIRTAFLGDDSPLMGAAALALGAH
jgi:glucokinase